MSKKTLNTKVIYIYADFQERNLSNSVKVARLIEKINIQGACSVILNLANCLIDYPNTSLLLDHVLTQLAITKCNKKNLLIQFDFVPSEEITLNYLFVGSKFMGIEESKAYNLDDLKKVIYQVLNEKNIDLSFEEINDSGDTVRTISLR